jgi:hypothetical protein
MDLKASGLSLSKILTLIPFHFPEMIRANGESNNKDGSGSGSTSSSSSGLASDITDLYWDSWDMNKLPALEPFSSSPRIPTRTRIGRNSVPSEEYLLHGGSGGFLVHHSTGNGGTRHHHHHHHHHNIHTTCSTTPCTPVTTIPPSSLTSPAFSPGSHSDIYSPTTSSVFSASSSASQSSYDPGLTPPSTPPVKSKGKLSFENSNRYELPGKEFHSSKI